MSSCKSASIEIVTSERSAAYSNPAHKACLMMNKDRYSVAVRRPDGEIEVKVEQHKPLTKHKELLKVPILRGVFSFADSMIVGMSSLMYSASFYEDEEEKKKPATKEEEEQQKAKKEKTDRLMMQRLSLWY